MDIHFIHVRKPMLSYQGDGTFWFEKVSNVGGFTLGFSYEEVDAKTVDGTSPNKIAKISFAVANALNYNFMRSEGRRVVVEKLTDLLGAFEPVKDTGFIYCAIPKGDDSDKFAVYRQEVLDTFMARYPSLANSRLIRNKGYNVLISKTKLKHVANIGSEYA